MSQAKASKKKTPKRKRPGPEEQYQQERIANYSKLHHASTKLLHRESKLVKSFECQKIVRSLKSANDTLQRLLRSSGETKEAEKARKRVSSLESKLERTKKLELDSLVSVVLKRLGVTSLHPDNRSIPNDEEEEEEDPSIENEDNKNDEEVKQPPSQDEHTTTLIEQMLRHKRLSTAMDQINDKVSDYQSWITHRRELVLNNGDNFESKKKSGKKTKKNTNSSGSNNNETLIVARAGSHATKRRKIDLGGHEGTSGLFIGSLSGQLAEGYDRNDHDEGYDDDEGGYCETKKKNRPGQRARKAKAMAIEAKKAGRTWDSSINWREKKKEDNAQHRDGNGGREEEVQGRRGRDATNKRRAEKRNGGNNNTKPSADVKSQDIATMGKSWKEEGKAHPSWAAAAAQKSQGIVEFKGTKITF